MSIRSYTPAVRTHSHRFHQVVVPLRGSMEMRLDGIDGAIAVGHCAIVQKGVDHSFRAKGHARFLVADLDDLPASARSLDNPFATVSNAFRSFCLFADIQLGSQVNVELEAGMVDVFKQLLGAQDFLPHVDRRISRALEYIDADISEDHRLETLAAVASLSVSQFKVLFARHTGKTLGHYLAMLRMETARALLINTDSPISRIAADTGYTDQSAFTRRFRAYHGESPGEYRKRQEQ